MFYENERIFVLPESDFVYGLRTVLCDASSEV